ncbi:DUF2842 domain-containing protein [Parasphingopyxis sp. CP4]|uniref:DUF2842 domain-containing protein n=1 Tax=Parasphingopyxis sp. CP4 TaxID=2724527 RepID=UPI0015A0D307|nr:DUF2842 domain-containing protein [Parasphingopyxis sp. CP4]QLC21709.1 DUF2842 domain-containing protein [Parasphingopyxis sp. CP4]
MNPSWRKPFGIFVIIGIIIIWAVIVASASGPIGTLPALVQAPIYLVAGIIWILPLKPLLQWMETGKWRE